MTEYTTFRVPEDAYEKAIESKKEDETWGDFINRCSNNPPEIVEYVDADDVDIDATGDSDSVNIDATEVAEELHDLIDYPDSQTIEKIAQRVERLSYDVDSLSDGVTVSEIDAEERNKIARDTAEELR